MNRHKMQTFKMPLDARYCLPVEVCGIKQTFKIIIIVMLALTIDCSLQATAASGQHYKVKSPGLMYYQSYK